MRNVLAYLKPYRVAVMVALLLMLMELAVELIQPLIMAKIIDDGIMQNDLQVVRNWGILLILITIVAFASGVINSFYAAHVSQNFGFDVRKALFTKVQSFSFANFNRFPTTSLITRLTNDVTQIQNTVFMSLRIMMRAPLLIIGGVVFAFIVNVKLALLLFAVIPFIFVFLFWVMVKGGVQFQSVQKKLDHVNSVMKENLAGIRIIKAFQRNDYEEKRFEEANNDLMTKTVHALRLMEMTLPILLLVMNASIIAILWFGSVQAAAGSIQVGEVVAIVNYAMRITAAFSIFSFIIMAFSRGRASADRISEVLELEPDITNRFENEEKANLSRGKIQFNHVSFTYPGTNERVLDDIHFTINPGQTVAIMGATGAGKTTLFQLIPRLYDVSEGEVLIDGQNVKSLKMDELRKAIGYVPQESLLFSGTIQENIAWGKEDASEEELIKAAVDAQISATIDKLPERYNTVIGQRGVNLSGGQKQRLTIARALVRKPQILLLDDSTSALDMKTEVNLLQAIKVYKCTTMIITQKVHTAQEADYILLLHDGRLIAEGKHEELLKHSEFYRHIYQSQTGEDLKHA